MGRDFIVVDIETSGLLPGYDVITEVAWFNMTTGLGSRFVPKHDVEWVLEVGDKSALEMTGYRERLANAPQEDRWEEFADLIRHNTLAGCNPAFDTRFISEELNGTTPWHYRLADLEAYWAGAKGCPPNDLVGLDYICSNLWVKNRAPHTAMGDVLAEAQCFAILVPDWRVGP